MDLIISIAIFAFSAGITPGPNNIMLMSSGINFGIKLSLPHLLGICLGFPIMVLSIGLGLSEVFQSYPILHTIIKYIGITYLLYLAWIIANSRGDLEGKNTTNPLSFLQALAFQWVNPKGWIIAIGAIATFTTLQANLIHQVLTISLVFFCVALPCALVWLGFGVSLKRVLTQPKQQRIFNIIMALLLVASIIPMLGN